ncbi:Zn-ribbon domain-containing OB-fold protein [Candidatus Bathyarchaeota archaeon]|nr:MAG: Zn-ribbon domain-containing OB-fold protein [Candidatus Bathyarchaeota archaeon]
MPILEKIVKSEDAKHWADSIPLEFHYTAGVAGEEFLRELKDNGRLIASKCPKCKNSYVPARMYCATCFLETKDRHNITSQGVVYSFAVVDRDRSGKKLPKPAVIALVKFEGIKGGIVHLLDVESSKDAAIGMKVSLVLKDRSERVGSLLDILGFRPT